RGPRHDAAARPNTYRPAPAGPDKRFGTKDDKTLPLKRATYNSETNTVTLTPRAKLDLKQPLQLIIRERSGVADRAGNALDGNRDGRAGGDYLGRFGAPARAASVSALAVDLLSLAVEFPTWHTPHTRRRH